MKRIASVARVVFCIVLALLLLIAGFCAWIRPDRALRIATADVAQTLCADVFVSGQAADRVYAENIAADHGMQILLRGLRYNVDTAQKKVSAQWHGHFDSVATYYPGYGCALPPMTPDAATLQAARAVASTAAPHDMPVISNDASINAALDHAFAEPPNGPRRQVHAIVIVHNGSVIAERYAAGFNPDTPQLGYSMSKSVVNALLGTLVRQGKLSVDMPAPVQTWQRTKDPRNKITLDQLSRMTAGLDLTEDDSGFDPVSNMLLLQKDMALFASYADLRVTPGTEWDYTSGNTLILAGVLRDVIGDGAPGMIRYAHKELLDPLGMQHVLMEFDGAQTLVGSTRIYASARDWARFGQLYLDDGVVNGRRILPVGWSAYASRQTLDSIYGAGFWTNTGVGADGHHIIAGMPGDAYFASGKNGQRILIVPSRQLVIVRLGSTIDPPNYDMRGLVQLVNEVSVALH